MATLTNALSKDELAIESLAKVWVESCLGYRCPHDRWLLGLLRTAGEELAEQAIRRTGKKLQTARMAGDIMPPESGRSYCGATAERMARGLFSGPQASDTR